MRIGFTSVTFREKTAEEVIELARASGAQGMEWGGDVHVPPGNLERAKQIRRACEEQGLRVFSYGSYLRCLPGEDIHAVMETTKALAAPMIRVWAGDLNEGFQAVAGNLKEITLAAGAQGMNIGLEYHRGTFTQNKESALALLDAVNAENLYCYWQPNPQLCFDEHLREIHALGKKLAKLHVFCWRRERQRDVRHALSAGREEWLGYIKAARQYTDPDLILEFVKDDCEQQFLEDMRTLKIIAERV